MRNCADCDKDITARGPSSKRCEVCSEEHIKSLNAARSELAKKQTIAANKGTLWETEHPWRADPVVRPRKGDN